MLPLLPLVFLGGCTTIEDFLGKSDNRARVEVVPVSERPVEEPTLANHYVIESPQQSVVGVPQIVLARGEDTLSDLARAYGLGYDELIAANPEVDPWLPGDQTPVLLPTQFVLPSIARQGIVLNIASKRLFYFPKTGESETSYVMTYPIGIGRVGWDTPLGDAKVISKAKDPQWYVPASVRREHADAGDPLPAIVPAGPDNPLGQFVLKLDMPGYLIHGTNQPYGVGMRVSHGCVRLYPENIELLYSEVGIGEAVTIINEPYLAGWRSGELYFESHEPLEDDEISPEEHLQTVFATVRNTTGAFTEEVEQDHARAIASAASGVPVRVLKADVAEVYERARIVRNTVELDPDLPTLAEVREILDTPVEIEDADMSVETVEQAMNDE